MVAIVQHDMHLERSTYEVLEILSISLTDKTQRYIYIKPASRRKIGRLPLQDLFKKTNFNDVKDQFNPLIPGLFD